MDGGEPRRQLSVPALIPAQGRAHTDLEDFPVSLERAPLRPDQGVPPALEAGRSAVQTGAQVHRDPLRRPEQAALPVAQAIFEGPAIGDRKLGGLGGGGRPTIGDQVTDTDVDLVPDRGDHRDSASGDLPGEGLVVEGPEVLGRAPATAENDQLDVLDLGQATQGRAQLSGRIGALDLAGSEQHRGRHASADDLQDVVDRRARGTRDHADTPGPRRQSSLALGLEQALGRELLLALLEREGHLAQTAGLRPLPVELKATLGHIDTQAPEHPQALALGETKAEPADAGRPHRHRERRLVVAQREVGVAAAGQDQVRDLALDPQRLKAALEGAVGERHHLSDRQHGRTPPRPRARSWTPWTPPGFGARAIALARSASRSPSAAWAGAEGDAALGHGAVLSAHRGAHHFGSRALLSAQITDLLLELLDPLGELTHDLIQAGLGLSVESRGHLELRDPSLERPNPGREWVRGPC